MNPERWKQVDSLLHLALERPAEEREAFLRQACGGDESLEREVRSLLASEQNAGSFLDSPAIEVGPIDMVAGGSFSDPSTTLEPGAMVAHYRVTGKLGAGGMGVVYRASDTKLQRDVALKILPEAMARDAQRMARFEREAQVLASLNNPNIAAIHGLEESNGIRALVMELVEGETLAERISVMPGFSPASASPKVGSTTGEHRSSVGEDSALRRERGALPYQDALPIAKQIAEALEYAHERGVIHRDLKPSNIKITPEGTVKVLDFGLAKVLTPLDSPNALDPANSPTLSAMATQAGMILGTASYMSPEQAKGRTVDRRCDIWAFGCVLYEMLSGQKAFEGETISDVLAAVLTKEPDWNALPGTTPPSIQRLVRRCLQKDQRQRLQAIGDARIAIEETISGVGEPSVLPREGEALPYLRPQGSPLRRALPWVLGVTGILAAVFLVIFSVHLLLRPKGEKIAIRFSVSPPENTVIGPRDGDMSLSPDGRQLAFVGIGKDGTERLWIRSFNELAARPLPGTEGAEWPFWSPDSRHLGFDAGGKLKKIRVSGGPVQTLGDASAGGGTWNREGIIVFANEHVLYRVSEAGGTPVRVVTPDAVHHELDYLPQFLPDGRHFLFCALRGDSKQAFTKVASLDSKEVKVLLKTVKSTALYAPPGYLLYLQEGVLMARPFDAKRLDFTAEAVSVAEEVGSNPLYANSYFSASSNGVLAYQTSAIRPTNELLWFNRKGANLGSLGDVGVYSNPAISPDGERLAVGSLDSKTKTGDIWVYDLRRGTGSPLTFDPASTLDPAWSPDGKQIMFTSEHQGVRGIYHKSADGLGKEELDFAHKVQVKNIDDWSADGRYALYEDLAPKTGLWALPLVGQRKPFAYVQGEFSAHDGQFSPKGRYVAYTSNETGRPEVFVQTFPDHHGKWQVSTSGGSEPSWRRDGNELFYLKTDGTVMSVNVKTTAGEFQPGIPRPLFRVEVTSSWRNRYAVSPDGQRFLMVVPTGEARPVPITVVVNWPALLKKE